MPVLNLRSVAPIVLLTLLACTPEPVSTSAFEPVPAPTPEAPATPAVATPPADSGCGPEAPAIDDVQWSTLDGILEFVITGTDADGALSEGRIVLSFDADADGALDSAAFPELEAAFAGAGAACEVGVVAVGVQLPIDDPALQIASCTDYDFAFELEDADGHRSTPHLFTITTPAPAGASCDVVDPDPLPDPTPDPIPTGIDDDGDGITVQDGDCDDAEPLIHPYAFEFDDGIDNNCDGNIDEPLLASPSCGDGILDAGEACDDGNLVPWDGCNDTCTGGCFVWSFNDETTQGWTSVTGEEGWAPQTTQTPHTGFQLIPDPFADRDRDHDLKIFRSPEFNLDPSRPIQAWLRGGAARGTSSGPLPTSPGALALHTDAWSGLQAMGLAVRSVSDDTYLAARAKAQSGYSTTTSDVTFAAGSLPATRVTLDLFDSYAGSWGWIGLDDVQVCAVP